MAIHLEKDERTLNSAVTLLTGPAKAGLPSSQVAGLNLPKEIEEFVNSFFRAHSAILSCPSVSMASRFGELSIGH